jgi:hypothetical protein
MGIATVGTGSLETHRCTPEDADALEVVLWAVMTTHGYPSSFAVGVP